MTVAQTYFNSGELNEAIKGLTLKAGVYAGLSREQITALMDGLREALEDTRAAEAAEIYSRYVGTGNLPGEAE